MPRSCITAGGVFAFVLFVGGHRPAEFIPDPRAVVSKESATFFALLTF